MQPLSLEERVELGIYNGYMMGLTLRDYNKIAVLSQPGVQCIATASSLISTFRETTRGVARYFPLVKERLRKTLDRLVAFEPQATVVIVGGEERLEECQLLLRKVLDGLASVGFKSDIVVCLRGYIAGCIRDIATANIEILSYMELMKYLHGWSVLSHSVDLDRKVFVLGKMTLVDEEVRFEEVYAYPLLVDHYELLKKITR